MWLVGVLLWREVAVRRRDEQRVELAGPRSGGRGGYGGTIAGTLIIVFSESILRIVNIADAGRRIAYGVLILVLLVSYGRGRSLRSGGGRSSA
jgi:hypothetical protein